MSTVSAEIAVRVVWSPSARETLSVELTLPPGSTLAAALAAAHWPDLASAGQGDAAFAAAGMSAAVWNKARPLAHVLRELQIDPMNARRVRFEAAGGIDALRRRGYAGRKR